MIRSMTGFGRAGACCPLGTVEVELRCTNGRFFKFYPRLPVGFLCVEHRLEQLCRRLLGRASVDLFVKFVPSPDLVSQAVDKEKAVRWAEVLRQLAQALGLERGVTLDTLISLEGVVGSAELTTEQVEGLWPTLEEALTAATESVQRMRTTEGEALFAALLRQLDEAGALVQEIRQRTPHLLSGYRERLLQRLNELLTPGGAPVNEQDLGRELALFAERSDITEEVDRFESHLAQVRSALESGGKVGKRLEFLAQELHREANTMGAKSCDARLSQLVIDLKTCVERIREQVMNVL